MYIKSKQDLLIRKGLEFCKQILLDNTITSDPVDQDFYHKQDDYKRDALYFVALGYFHLKDYSECKKWLERLISYDPNSEQAHRFLKLTDAKIQQEGLEGLFFKNVQRNK